MACRGWWILAAWLVAPSAWSQTNTQEQPPEQVAQVSGPERDAGVGHEAVLAQARQLLEAGKAEDAIQLLEPLAKVDPTARQLRLVLGRAYLDTSRLQSALEEYSALVKVDAKDFEANWGRARALVGIGDAQKALSHARLCTEKRPDSADAWELLGDTLLHPSVQDFQGAAEAYKKTLALDPKRRESTRNLARALSHLKELEQAITVLEAWRKDHPDDVEVLVKLAESLFVDRKLDQAEEVIQRALLLAPGHEEALRVNKRIQSKRTYIRTMLWVAAILFPLLYLLIRWMRRGKVPKLR